MLLKQTCCCVTIMLLLTACAGHKTELDSAQHIALLEKDRIDIYQDASGEISLSLQEALRYGAQHNLEAQVAALEVLAAEGKIDLARIGAYPSLNASASYIGRSNKGAASSRSIITGTQSLEPSYSTEQYRDVQDLTANWSTLNILLAISEAQKAKMQAIMAQERYTKVLQNVERDIYVAYNRALIAQKNTSETAAIMREAEKHLKNLNVAANKNLLSHDAVKQKERNIRERLISLKEQQNQLSVAETELKNLLSLPQSSRLNLTEKTALPRPDIALILKEDLRALEAEALKNRPEVREQVVQRDQNLQNIREEAIRTFPGGDLFFAFNRDSNEFLNESNWANFSLTIEQSLTSLLSYNTRRQNAKNQKQIDDARRKALILAVMTQVHLARHRLDYLYDIYDDRYKEYKNADYLAYTASKKQSAGFETTETVILQKLERQAKKMSYYQSLMEVQDAYAAMKITLARPLE